jgi:Protein of unknown function (DUF2846)
MLRRVAAVAVLTVMVSGCVTERSGVDFASMSQKIGPPKAGQARIVLFREQAFAGIFDQGWNVKLDGSPMGELKTGTYVYADRPAGRHQLSYEVGFFPGLSQRDFTAVPGRTYFFLTKVSDRAKALNAAQASGGLVGLAAVSALTSSDGNPGPVDLLPLEETAAREAISALRLAE